MARVTVHYWAAARHAAGVPEERQDAETLAHLLATVAKRHPGTLAELLTRCAFLVDDLPVGHRDHADVTLTDGAVVEVLPPFAGG
ncbi:MULTISPECIES: MoaD/ThiS family protein [Protofrankia]|uniref:Thiamine biosynthesis protein ThiS n=1 Tax=Protofrankia coriariae TaxID=1562887 RepID=A0ABR5F1B4_9ACTN|nr:MULTISPECIES: MoaD/ThiS family protein [Protofrankia]KLL10452.1 thiamine biosynthesis protein ThiS [Protofrankia coriariae]ONH33047.1 molybdopterin synthase sulfur carrier subunit [Protofrankia sp. BMG5.30]